MNSYKMIINFNGSLKRRRFFGAVFRRGQKGSLSEVPETQGGPGFRIVRFRMQNSSAQTTACGRDDVFFLFRAEIQTSADSIIFFSSRDLGAPLTKGPKQNFCPGARNFPRRPWLCCPVGAMPRRWTRHM